MQDGIVRMRWRNYRYSNISQPMVPGQMYGVEVMATPRLTLQSGH